APGVVHTPEQPRASAAIHVTAPCPAVLAACHRRRQGLYPLKPRPELGHAANYLYMLTGTEASPDLVRALNTYLVLLADHGMNASTFTARVIASTDSDLAPCLLGALPPPTRPPPAGPPSPAPHPPDQLPPPPTPA